MLVAAGKVHHLGHFGFGHFEAEDADHGEAFLVHGQHQFERLGVVHAEKPLKHVDDEFHRRVVVVQEHDLVERWLVGLRLGLGQQAGIALTALAVVAIVVRCHHMKLESAHQCLYASHWDWGQHIGVRPG